MIQKKKILKVRSQNDYVFEIFEPIINFQYVNECVKLNKLVEYVVVDNPGTPEISNQSGKNINTNVDANMSLGDLNTSAVGGLRRAKAGGKYDLRSIAAYNPTLNNYTGDIGNPIVVLEKQINRDKDKNEKTEKSYNTRYKKPNVNYSGRKGNYVNTSTQNNLESFVNILNQELEKEIE